MKYDLNKLNYLSKDSHIEAEELKQIIQTAEYKELVNAVAQLQINPLFVFKENIAFNTNPSFVRFSHTEIVTLGKSSELLSDNIENGTLIEIDAIRSDGFQDVIMDFSSQISTHSAFLRNDELRKFFEQDVKSKVNQIIKEHELEDLGIYEYNPKYLSYHNNTYLPSIESPLKEKIKTHDGDPNVFAQDLIKRIELNNDLTFASIVQTMEILNIVSEFNKGNEYRQAIYSKIESSLSNIIEYHIKEKTFDKLQTRLINQVSDHKEMPETMLYLGLTSIMEKLDFSNQIRLFDKLNTNPETKNHLIWGQMQTDIVLQKYDDAKKLIKEHTAGDSISDIYHLLSEAQILLGNASSEGNTAVINGYRLNDKIISPSFNFQLSQEDIKKLGFTASTDGRVHEELLAWETFTAAEIYNLNKDNYPYDLHSISCPSYDKILQDMGETEFKRCYDITEVSNSSDFLKVYSEYNADYQKNNLDLNRDAKISKPSMS